MEKSNHKITTIVGILALCWGTLGISVMSWAAIDNTLHYDDLSAPYLLPLSLIVIWSLPTFIGKDLE